MRLHQQAPTGAPTDAPKTKPPSRPSATHAHCYTIRGAGRLRPRKPVSGSGDAKRKRSQATSAASTSSLADLDRRIGPETAAADVHNCLLVGWLRLSCWTFPMAPCVCVSWNLGGAMSPARSFSDLIRVMASPCGGAAFVRYT